MTGDIRGWLKARDFEQYADAFEENLLTPDDLSDLTDADLKELGIAAMGHRKALLRAIGEDTPSEAAPTQETATEPAAPASVVPPHSGAERRQLTVMFADLVGSTDLAGRLDPEDMRDAITAYQNAVAGVVTRYEGHVAKYMGDGVLCYFGWPMAHEDDAERAARAGLDIIAALAPLTATNGEDLEARIGIATGLVIVGDLVGEGAAQEEAVVGETPNLAARLQGLAIPGQVVVAESTRRLLSPLLEVESLGSHDLKGIGGTVEAFEILSTHGQSNGDLDLTVAASALVGRDSELDLLRERWSFAQEGEGQVFILSGEAGIGKSQITSGFIGEIMTESPNISRLQCSPYYMSTAFYPVIGYLEQSAGITRNDATDTKLDKLEALLRPTTVSLDVSFEEAAALLAAMLSLPMDRYPDLRMEPLRQKELTIGLITSYFFKQAADKNLLLLVEDIQWCDASTLDLIGHIIALVEPQNCLALITHRPDFVPSWPDRAYVTAFTLKRLGRRYAQDIIGRVTDGIRLPDEITEQILSKTDGVPLFIEELTKHILEAGFLTQKDDAYILEGPLPDMAIPTTLQDSLMARLDRLSPVKEIAQLGACIGREFDHQLLTTVAPLQEAELSHAVGELIDHELIFQRGQGSDAVYVFKQALVQDAAYSSLLKSRRHQLHTAIAQSLEKNFPDKMAQQPEVAAQHYQAAGLMAEAVPLWLAAGQQAIAKYANEEAINHLSAGLVAILTLSEGPERDQNELLMRATLGVAQFTARGYGTDELGENYATALSIVRRIGQSPFQGPAMFGVWAYHTMRVQHDTAEQIYHEALEHAEISGSVHEKTAALAAGTTTYIFQGKPEASWVCGNRSWQEYDKSVHSELVTFYGQDIGLWTFDFSCWAAWLLGKADDAAERYGEANRLAKELGHPLSLASGLVHASLLYSMIGDVDLCNSYADETIEVCEEVGIPARLVEGWIMKGWAMAKTGQIDEGIALTQQGMAGWRGAGAEIARPWWLTLNADQYMMKNDYVTALATVDEGLAILPQSGENIWAPELNRKRGDILLHLDRNNRAEAISLYQKALAIAADQPSKYWELRAACSLAQLMLEDGEKAQAMDLLKPRFDWFEQGKDHPDLQQAQNLLQSLGA